MRRDWKSFACGINDHFSCLSPECTCSCHGDEPPAGVREPRQPDDPVPVLSARADTD